MALKNIITGLFGGNDINDEYFIYDNLFISDKLMAVILNGKCGIIEIGSLKELLPCKYQDVINVILNYIDGESTCALRFKSGEWLYLSHETWKECCPFYLPNFIWYSPFKVAVFKKEKEFIFLDNKGKQIQAYSGFMLGRN